MAEKFIPYAELDVEQQAMVDSENPWERRDAARQGYGLDKLVADEDEDVRFKIAEQGYGLDILVDDPDPAIRLALAKQGYGLDRLVGDEHPLVREAVAKQGFGLDKLVADEYWKVRCAVAEQGFGLDKLVDDKNSMVRETVAEQGYGLEKLVDDKNLWVRAAVAKQGYGLDKLVDDPNHFVRQTVAEQGYALDKLVNDEDWGVRAAVAGQGYGLDKLVDDPHRFVRQAVAEQGYALDKLVDDEDWCVREAVAEQGYGLDKLVDDLNEDVRAAAFESMGFNPERFAQEWAAANPDKCVLEENRLREEKGSGERRPEKAKQPGEDGWTYRAKGSGRTWTFEEIVSLYGGNEELAAAVGRAMKGQEPVECFNKLFEEGVLVGDKKGYWSLWVAPPLDKLPVEEYLVWFMPEAPVSYENASKGGYTILERYLRPDGQLDVLAMKHMEDGRNEYVVGCNYDVESGTWGYGRYSSSVSSVGQDWDEVRGRGQEKATVLTDSYETRSMAVPVKDGYLVAMASAGHWVDSPGAVVSLGLYNAYGELLQDLASVQCVSEGEYLSCAFEIGEDEPSFAHSFDADDIGELAISEVAEERHEYVQLPDRSIELGLPQKPGLWGVEDVVADRKPGELKSAGDKPKQPQGENAVPAQDARACCDSAKAQSVDAILDRVNKKR